MSFKIENDYTVKLFGKEFNKMQHIGLIFGYIFFLMFIWPILSGSAFFMPFGVALLPLFLPFFVYGELVKSKRVFNILLYGGLVITTFIYTYFFLDSSFIMMLVHYVVYAGFGYIVSKKM